MTKGTNVTTIRKAMPEDFDALYRLGLETPEFAASQDGAFMLPEEFRAALGNPDGVMLLAGRDDEVAGFVYANCRDPETPPDGRIACLVYLVVRPRHRGQGIARQLHDACLDVLRARGMTYVYGWARSGADIVGVMRHLGYRSGHEYTFVEKSLGAGAGRGGPADGETVIGSAPGPTGCATAEGAICRSVARARNRHGRGPRDSSMMHASWAREERALHAEIQAHVANEISAATEVRTLQTSLAVSEAKRLGAVRALYACRRLMACDPVMVADVLGVAGDTEAVAAFADAAGGIRPRGEAGTMNPWIETGDLASTLDSFGTSPGRYHAVGAFADDLSARARTDVVTGRACIRGIVYHFSVSPGSGAVHLVRGQGGPVPQEALDLAIAESSRQRGGLVGRLPLLALLTGDPVGTPGPGEKVCRRVFPLQMDFGSRRWAAYTDGLLDWMKSRLVHDPEDGLPAGQAGKETR